MQALSAGSCSHDVDLKPLHRVCGRLCPYRGQHLPATSQVAEFYADLMSRQLTSTSFWIASLLTMRNIMTGVGLLASEELRLGSKESDGCLLTMGTGF